MLRRLAAGGSPLPSLCVAGSPCVLPSSSSSSLVSVVVSSRRWMRPGEVTPGTDLRRTEQWARSTNDDDNAGYYEHAPRAVGDFTLDSPDQVVPGAHPLPLNNANTESALWPLASPYMPSPQRPHPYFSEPLPELPHFECSVPVVYPFNTMKSPIVVPVHNIEDGTVSHTRTLDPYVFGQYPQMTPLSEQAHYWVVRNQNYKSYWELGRLEIFRKAKKNWANTGTGMGRVSDRKNARYPWGGRPTPNKPWNLIMPTADPEKWHTACRMTLCLKMLQGKLMVVDRLTIPEPTTAAFRDLCDRMQWDVRSTGAGVLFMDGGSRLTPSTEFDKAFFLGSFVQGRVKVVRPTIRVEEPYDWNLRGTYRDTYWGPRGQKNPVPVNRFNIFDALDHHLLVLTEGAVLQLEREMLAPKVKFLPPHIRNQMAEFGMLDHHLLGSVAAPVEPIEMEAAGRAEERERAMYAPYYDNPYRPWHDEQDAEYEVDADAGYIRRSVRPPSSTDNAGDAVAAPRPRSWRKIQ